MAAEQIFHPSHLLQALLKPLQKKPAMGPRVLAKRLMAAQWRRKGECTFGILEKSAKGGEVRSWDSRKKV